MKIISIFCVFIFGFSFSQTNHHWSNLEMEKTYKNILSDTIALNKLITSADKKHNPDLKIFALNKLGAYYRDKSHYGKSLIFHEKALSIARQNQIQEQIIVSENLLGVVYRRRDDIIPAIDHHQKALELAENIKNPNETILRNIAISYNSLGNIYLTMNQLEDASWAFQRSLGIENKIGNNLGLAINYQNIGGIYERQGNLTEALKNYEKSLAYNQKINSALGKVICNNSIGTIYLKQNNIAKAEEYLNAVIQQATELQDDFYISASYVNEGWLYWLEGNENAKEYLKKGLDIAEKQNYLSTVSDASELLYKIYNYEKDYKNAFFYYQKYKESQEKLVNATNLRYSKNLKSKYLLEKKKNEFVKLQSEHEKTKLKLVKNRTLFISILLIVLLMMLALYIGYRQKKLLQDKKMLQLERNILNLQMNPHFVFNSLNAIKSLIIKEDKEKAIFYLNRFSKLFRTILNGGYQEEITLKEELENIRNYVELENMRFSDQITFEIQENSEIPLEKIKIPSLLLQVFVENSIWHGLSTKEGEKKIIITLNRQKNNKVLIQIFDNGVGRKQAMDLNIGSISKKESLGLKITTERLENYYNKEYQLEIIDLMDNNISKGTLVNLIIPMIKS